MTAFLEKYNDPKWQKKRLEIFSRDNWQCQRCGDNKSELAVHHKRYYDGKAPWEYDENDLVTLCINCHEGEHQIDNSSKLTSIIDKNIDVLELTQREKRSPNCLHTGLLPIDSITSGLHKREISLVASRPEMDQFYLALAILQNIALKEGKTCLVFSISKTKLQIGSASLFSISRVDQSRYENGYLSKEDFDRLKFGAGLFSDAPIFIDDTSNYSASSIVRKIKQYKSVNDVDFILIDYLELISSNQYELTELVRQLKNTAKDIDVHIMILAHCDKKLDSRTDRRPQLGDLKIEGLDYYPDTIFFVYRDRWHNSDQTSTYKDSAEIIIAKNSHGFTGSVSLKFSDKSKTFDNWPEKKKDNSEVLF